MQNDISEQMAQMDEENKLQMKFPVIVDKRSKEWFKWNININF